jgi:two-component system OmpR family response regulator
MRLLLLEDDLPLGEGLRDFLESEAHVVDWCTTVAQARIAMSEPFDAWLLDWNLPDGSGIDLLRGQRAKGNKTPAFVLTARDSLNERIRGLDSGADDFLVKPFAPEELCARLRVIARRVTGGAPHLSFGNLQIDLAAKTARRDGSVIDFTAREWAILEALVLRTGRIVSRADLEALVLGFDSELASNSIEVHIFKLRSKLGKSFIETIRGLGYRVPEPSAAS